MLTLPVVEPAPRLLLVALWLLWAALLFGGCALGRLNAERTRRMPAWTRLGSSLVLVAAAAVWALALALPPLPAQPLAAFAMWLAAGMALGCLGDFFMAGFIPVKEPVLGGMAAFGAGHLAYSAGFLGLSRTLSAPAPPAALLVWLLAAVVLWYVVVYRGSRRTLLHRAALPYALLLATTAGLATMTTFQDGALLLPAVGAALFLFSDLILAARLFNQRFFPLIDDVVWLTYGPGQMLIVYGLFMVAPMT
ncbi:MAG: lysoplasmalogenase [Anaerolineae bacterium]|jgi:uncharacterized membrane protein YhhN|nr:lysoplasmalogenase [Anaerolineae bacterium]